MRILLLTLLMGLLIPSYAAELPDLGIARSMGIGDQPVETTTTFNGGFSVDVGNFTAAESVDSAKPIHIMGQVNVDPNHVGQVADIIVYANFSSLDDPTNPALLMVGEDNTVLPWNFQPADLIAFTPQVTLQATQEIDIYNDFLPEGNLQVFFGYLLPDALIVNQQPIDIILETVPEPLEIQESLRTKQALSIDTTPLLISEEDRLVGHWAFRWANGSSLKVGFDFDGADFDFLPAVCNQDMSNSSCKEAVANEVIHAARKWSQYGNIYFQPSTWEEADIRIRFREDGSWSYIGTSAKLLAPNEETMNLAFSFLEDAEGFKRTVIHEFGHAIGLHHEHISPEIAYDWDEAQIISDTGEQGWSEEQTRSNIIDSLLKSESRSAFFTTDFDPKSIMIYPIPKRWVSEENTENTTLCPDAETTLHYCVGRNAELSELDKQGIAQFYPKRLTQGGKEGCSYTYDPSNYRASTAEQDEHTGGISFYNATSETVRVTLFHPHVPFFAFDVWDIPAHENSQLYRYSPLIISTDWGIKVNNSPVCIIGTVTNWRDSYFQASTSRIPGK